MTRPATYPALEALLPQCMNVDRPRFLKELHALQTAQARASRPQPSSQATPPQVGKNSSRGAGKRDPGASGYDLLSTRMEASVARALQRQKSLPTVSYATNLPVVAQRQQIADTIGKHQVVIVSGETGSGKTTQLPKICLELGRGVTGLIGHTQPRRIAASTVASRIAEELQVPLGSAVGYQVRFQDQCSDLTLVKLMTDGILLAEIRSDPDLLRYDTLIIDEAHERSLNIDFILGYIKQILPRRPDLKVIITSATIDVHKFAVHFDDAPVIAVAGRTYPVALRYQPPATEEDLPAAVVSAVEELLALPQRGDILVFVSGEREIRDVAQALRKAELRHVEVLPLYARLGLKDQRRVFQAHTGTRIILATNVAETSITVPGVRYVVDTGYARVSRYSYRTKVQRLPIEPISQASANQRAGRCGRLADGVCIRLYSEQDFAQRPEFSDPEILRTNLAAVILQMLQFRVGDVRRFPFVDPPDNRFINDGYNLLAELGAVDSRGQLTDLGRQMARLPVDPKFGRMLLAANREGCLRELLVIVAALSVQDPRERPTEKRQAVDEKHRQWVDPDSDFYTLWNMWTFLEAQRQALSKNQFASLCRQLSVSYMRMREWRELHHQLHMSCRQVGFRDNHQPPDRDSIHRAMLSGLLGNIGFRHENNEYMGARNRRFHLFPGSGLAKKPPKWIMAGELIETSRLFAHGCAQIDPRWLSTIAAHRIKREYSEPHYVPRSGRIMAYEKQMLYGLVIADRRSVEFGKVNASLARQVFIQQALVEGRYGVQDRGTGQFAAHNRTLAEHLDDLEQRMRRRDIVADEQVVYQFYDERVPPEITSLAQFESWRKGAETTNPNLLYLDSARLAANMPGTEQVAQFPTSIDWHGHRYSLSYRFEPGHPMDGVSVQVPLAILHQVPDALFDWLVPGLLRDKVIAMLKTLPKQWRKRCVPLPDYADRALSGLLPQNRPLAAALGDQLQKLIGVALPDDCWRLDKLDAFYRINFILVDEQGQVLSHSKNLRTLRDAYQRQVEQVLNSEGSSAAELTTTGITSWNFEELPEVVVDIRNGLEIRSYPALVDTGDSVAIELRDNPTLAEYESRRGVVRLAVIYREKAERRWRKQLCRGSELLFANAKLPPFETLTADLIYAVYRHGCFDGQPLPRSEQAFNRCLDRGAGATGALALELEQLLGAQANALVELYALLRAREPQFPQAVADCRVQMAALFALGFLKEISFFWLRQMERYVRAALTRFERLPQRVAHDQAVTAELLEFIQVAGELAGRNQEFPLVISLEVEKLRFMIEEYRVSVYAQALKTAVPVSLKRLQDQRERIAAMLVQ